MDGDIYNHQASLLERETPCSSTTSPSFTLRRSSPPPLPLPLLARGYPIFRSWVDRRDSKGSSQKGDEGPVMAPPPGPGVGGGVGEPEGWQVRDSGRGHH